MTILSRTVAFAALLPLVAASRLEAQSSKITVTIAGGAHAGTYEETQECEVNPDQFPSIFFVTGHALANVKPNAPTKIEFFTASAKGMPDGFVLSLHFRGKPGERTKYDLNAIPPAMKPPIALPPAGSGSVTVTKTATGRTATFRGVTHDGVRMEGTLDCRSRSP